jgi:hypothetical protein
VVAQVLAGGLALQHPGGAGEEAQLVQERRHLLVAGGRHGLAGVAALGVDDLVRPGLDGVGQAQQGALPLGRGAVAPDLEAGRGGGERGVDVFGRGDRGGRVRLPGARIDDRGRPAVGRVAIGPADEVAEDR